jgi:hypothetical protein
MGSISTATSVTYRKCAKFVVAAWTRINDELTPNTTRFFVNK